MKRVKSLIKLTHINSERLNEKELSHVIGGDCHCGCFYASCGGSSRIDNDGANNSHGFVSPLPPFEAEWGIAT